MNSTMGPSPGCKYGCGWGTKNAQKKRKQGVKVDEVESIRRNEKE
jgi:hypothetical protein